jgi:hypothetical protein
MFISFNRDQLKGPLLLKGSVLVPISAKSIGDSLKPIFHQLFNCFLTLKLHESKEKIAAIFFFGVELFQDYFSIF